MNEVTNTGPTSASPAHDHDATHGKLNTDNLTVGQHFGSYPNNKAQEQDYEIDSDHGSDDSEAESLGPIEMIRTYPLRLGGTCGVEAV